MSHETVNGSLEQILAAYSESFSTKVFGEESPEEDALMAVFGLTQRIKSANKQYWGRELGMCWQLLVTALFREMRPDFRPGIVEGRDQLCDLIVATDAIDTKYRIGSGDAGTLKKFRQYGERLQQYQLRPMQLILRTDSLPQALAACAAGGWIILSGEQSYRYIYDMTSFDLEAWLRAHRNVYSSKRA